MKSVVETIFLVIKHTWFYSTIGGGGGRNFGNSKIRLFAFFSYYRAKLAEVNEIVIMWDSLLISKNIFVKY